MMYLLCVFVPTLLFYCLSLDLVNVLYRIEPY